MEPGYLASKTSGRLGGQLFERYESSYDVSV